MEMPEGVSERVQEQLDRWQTDEDAAKTKAEAGAEMRKGAVEKTEIA